MRSVWNGEIRVGQAAIAVKLYAATGEQSSGLHQLHLTDGGRIRQKRVCEVDGEEVPGAEIGKGYEIPGGEVVVLTDDDLARLPLPSAHAIDVRSFVPAGEVDSIYFSRSYYLEPEVSSAKSYVLLSEALQQSGRVAVGRIALRQKENLAVLRVRDQVIMLETMFWPDEVRSPDFAFLHSDIDITPGERREAVSLIEQLSETFVPREYPDRYRHALADLIAAKVDGNELAVPAAAEQQAGVVDLLTALRDNLAAKHPVPAQRDAVRKARTAARKAGQSAEQARKTAEKAKRTTKTRR